MVGLGLVCGLLLARHDPALLKERLRPLVQKDQVAADKVLMSLILLLIGFWLVFMALDAVRFGWSSLPTWVQAIGERAGRVVGALASQGILMSIDDFGTGFSSLGQLRHFPLDMLKVDRSFVHGVEHSAKDAAITANTTSTGLTADDASSLKQLSTGVRSAIQTGDTAAARTALDSLSTKVTELAAKLNTDAGKQLTAGIAALKAALPAS